MCGSSRIAAAERLDDQWPSVACAGWDRYHVLSRTAIDTDGNQFRFDFDAMQIRAQPGSPSPLAPGDTELSPLVPVDSNANPSNAKMDEDRVSLTVSDDADLKWGTWSTVSSDAFTHQHNIRQRGLYLLSRSIESCSCLFEQSVRREML